MQHVQLMLLFPLIAEMGVTWTPVLLLSLCLSGLGVADPVGKEFALVFMENSLPNVSMPHLKVFLSGFFSGTEVQVRLPNGSFEKVISLSPGSMEKVELPAELEILQCSRSNMTIRISSNKDISVSAANEKPSSTGVFLVYPVTDWGTEYYIVTPDRGPANTFAQIAIVNGPLMNPIEVDLEGYVQFEGRIYSPGEQLRITLGPWESVMLQSNGSLTGTHLKAQEPVGVFSGHSCAQRSTRCNQVCLQLPPVASWGFHFVVPTLKFHGNSDTLYVTAASPTVLDIRNGSSLLTKNLLPGYIQELAVDSFVLMDISSSAPVMVLLYGYAPRSLHVFLVNVLSTEDICTAYYLFLMPGYNSTALVVVHNDSTTELQYNNEELPYIDWRSVNGTDVLWGPMFLGTNGPNIISHPDEAFAVYSFGRNGMNMYTAAGVCLEQVLQSCKDQGCEGALCPLVEQPTCYTDYQTCMAWGSTYYRTFGGRHTFQPAQDCATLLIAYPGVMGEDWPFSVERSPEEEFSLTFRTYGDTVEVTEDMSGRIKQGYVGIDEDCQQNCSCPQFNQWQCEPLSCPSESICEVQEGVRNCYPREMLNPADHTECIFSPEAPACTNVITCGFYGSSRYETFGRTQWNQPSGVNALSVAYSCDSDLVYNVTATSESLGSVEEVIINVYGITIVIDRIQEIWVNETKIDVPTELVPGKVWLKAHSHAVLLKTDFGLTVLFKGGEYLFIMLPAGYLNSTCGLCAGVNMTMGLAATPSATVAAVTTPGAVATAAATPMTPVAAATLVTPVAAATSSAIVAVATPSEGNQSFSDTLSSWNCSDSDHPGASLCMILLDNDGPFGACHEVLDPYLYYDACLSSQCQKGGNIAGVCQSLQNYTLSCQQQNQTIEPWRNDSFCPFACPMNKHYSICVDPCGETCTAPNGTSSCNLTCIEGCECNVGLYREGDKCIPIEACGCNANGTYFKKGTEVFGDNCHRKCSCPRFDQWQCESFTCQPNQICDMWAGIERCFQKDLLAVLKALECLLFPKEPGCANYTNCAFIGKLGYLSFWKKVIFGGLSTSDSLSVAQSCVEANAGNSTNPFYDISVKFANGSEQQIESVLINVYDMDIVIEKSEHSKKFKVWANGIQVNSSSALIPGKIRLELDIVAVILGTDFGLSVVVNSPGYLYIFLPTSYLNSTCGLCAATVAQNTFSNTSVGNQTLNDIPVTWNCNNTDPTGSSLCRMLLDEDGPFGACHDVLSPSTYFNVCVDYQCDNKEDISAVCQSLQDYTDSCQAQNQTIKPWRNDSFCPYQCPPNSHYSVCADLCEPSCMAPNGSLSCDIICMEGCECDPGFYRQGDLCTPLQKCGCIDNGSYYPQGSVLVEACSQVCNCTQYQQWQCNPISCRPQQICDAQTGDPNCYPTGPTTSEENLQCVFYPNRSACAQDIHCAFSGRNGYLTFGRKFGFQHLPWPHVLPLAHSCDTDNIDNSIDSTYNVSVKVLDGSEKVMETVIINVYETDIVMEQKEQLRVWANGTPVVIPSVLIPDRVWLKQSDHFVILTTDFGLTVQNDGRYFLYIDLPQSYLNSTCGVCASTESPTDTTNGSWGGNQALNNATNTMPTNAVLGGGTQAVTSTPSSWHCNETDSMGAILCEMLLEINGPFAACHEVLSPSPYYDLCLSHLCQNGVYLPAVCQSLQSYTSACQAQNRSIEPWRNDRFCPFVCPGNSHYEICVDPCEATCSHPNRTSCDSLCMEGCECDQGFYAEYNLCLLIEDCGCYVNGSYYPQGYEIITEGCQWKCSCPQYNEWTCDPFSCRSNETCKWTNGARNCYPQGFSCPPGNEYSDCTTVCDRTCKNNSCLRPCMEGCQCPNGSYWDGNSCVTAEQCLGSGNQVQSSPQAIGVPCEISSQNSSQPLCLQCIVSSQNIITWNSTARSLEADVPYEILRVCEDSDKLWLRVVLQTLTTGQMLHVFFGQSFITVRSDLEVLVNGDTVLTPLTEFPDLQVDQSDNAVTISLPGDMVATFSWDGLLTIMVSMDFSTTLCGACAYGNMAPGNTTNNLLDCCKAEDFADL
uniref:VWFD domain-containing protein n=1 Tax=Xenopus tropicalis TaxID=8364 RepID=A0A803JX03_XENTR